MPLAVHASVRRGLLALLATIVLAPSIGRAELTAQDILLVANKRVPASRALAETYARQRHIPDGRIIELDVPGWGLGNPSEEISFAAYEGSVAQPIRDFLTRNNLTSRVKCIVTFWGVPLRIARRKLSAAEVDELASLKKQLDQDRQALSDQVAALEKFAIDLDPKFKPQNGSEIPALSARVQGAINSIFQSIGSVQDSTSRDAQVAKMTASMEALFGKDRTVEILGQPALARVIPHQPSPDQVAAARVSFQNSQLELIDAQGYESDADRRKKVLALSRASLGSLGATVVLNTQIDGFRVEESESALGNELALLWWHSYPRSRWLNNALNWRNLGQPGANSPTTLMVTRLDGVSEMNVRNLMKTSLEVERKGLEGQVVLDARGLPPTDPYGSYDQTIRNLNQFLNDHTSLKVTFDNQPPLISTHSLKDPIALYCGWYSLRHYAPPGPFAPGAVGYHIASLEMVSLHERRETGWVRGLLSDGVCATLGPVAEPYLSSFPPADEFFPLLLTGKLTMAEAYWRTMPMVSWMQDCVADPLYTPYKANPAVKIEDLPKNLQVVFQKS